MSEFKVSAPNLNLSGKPQYFLHTPHNEWLSRTTCSLLKSRLPGSDTPDTSVSMAFCWRHVHGQSSKVQSLEKWAQPLGDLNSQQFEVKISNGSGI